MLSVDSNEGRTTASEGRDLHCEEAASKGRSKNNLAQKRYRDRQKARREGIEEQVAVLTKRISELESTHESLEDRHRVLQRYAELADAKDTSLEAQALEELAKRERPTEDVATKFEGLMAAMYNLVRMPGERELTAQDCRGWCSDPKRYQGMKEKCLLCLWEMCGHSLNPPQEAQQKVKHLLERHREMRRQMSQLFVTPFQVWAIRPKTVTIQQEVVNEIPSVLPNLIVSMKLSQTQIDGLVKARRDFITRCNQLAEERASISAKLKTFSKRSESMDTQVEAMTELSDAMTLQKELQENIVTEGMCLRQFLTACLDIIPPWEEARLAMDAFFNHGFMAEVWEAAVYYESLDHYEKQVQSSYGGFVQPQLHTQLFML